jgi:hypothetical protein
MRVRSTVAEELAASGLPVTLRAHGFEFTAGLARRLLDDPQLRALFTFPNQAAAVGRHHKLQMVWVAFNPSLYHPPAEPKNRRLVLRAAAGLPTKDLELFFYLARELPELQFVLAVVTCNLRESYIEELLELNEQLGRPVDLRVDMSHPAAAALMQKAGIYLHTFDPAGPPYRIPVSIAEAMAGTYVVARRLPPAEYYVGDAGRL